MMVITTITIQLHFMVLAVLQLVCIYYWTITVVVIRNHLVMYNAMLKIMQLIC